MSRTETSVDPAVDPAVDSAAAAAVDSAAEPAATVTADPATTDPASLFDAWMTEFRALIAADAGLCWPPVSAAGADTTIEVPPVLMTLATVGPDGYPLTRNVMVSHTGAAGVEGRTGAEERTGRIWFHTDSRSEKARHLADNPRVSLTVLAADRSKQVTVVGDAVRSDPAEEAQAYTDRSRYLQLLAWLNDADLAGRSETERHRVWASFADAHPDLASTPPETWVGFAVVPREYLFWTADSDGPSRRLRYIRTDTGSTTPATRWALEVLPG